MKREVTMDQQALRHLLQQVASGERDVDAALQALRALPFESLDYATLDHHRHLRWGFPEVIFCAGKTPEQVAGIAARLADRGPRLLGTRATPEQYAAARRLVPDLQYHELARCLWLDREPDQPRHPGVVAVAAGTSDLPVLEEAILTLELMGHRPQRIVDVGVAGLHRLLPHVQTVQTANVVVVAAGMEGALASVVGGLTDAPVIAVPTSVGYGASFGGLAALLAMLNSCASGVAVVNIDNGFGAGHLAALINQRIVDAQERARSAQPALGSP
ncbi:nickel pincer cofactor biosynthesis protein LarB [Litorilinea aerophila]|nr:nickel pincer cofactor biosynthesis protein LarB [Litorilinea aerophila]MCC9075502.1 nickel pincer cofactor biosynthesis protein LarB [Litorilinea aerophila]